MKVSPGECAPRWATPRTGRDTLGPRVAKVMSALRTPPFPWQSDTLDVALEISPATGLLVYRVVIITVPRQSGKTKLELGVAAHRCVTWPDQVVTYTAQTRVKAKEKWLDDHLKTLSASPFAPLFRPRLTTGLEALLWNNGSKYGIESTTEKAGHGDTLDLGFIDEAFAQVDARTEQAMKPAMLTRPQPQLWIVSTAGTPASVFLRQKVDMGRALAAAGSTDGVAYFEWSAPEDADPADPATWWGCMPALGVMREDGAGVTEAAVRADFQSMSLREFRRGYLNQWLDAIPEEWLVIPQDWWESTALADSHRPARVTFAIDTTPDRAFTSVAAAGDRGDGVVQLELADHEPGTRWVVQRAQELDRRWNPVCWVVDKRAQAGSLITAMEDCGLNVIGANAVEVAHACSGLYDAFRDGTLRHDAHEDVRRALGGAQWRLQGEQRVFNRRAPNADLSPLYAFALAHWGWQRHAAGGDYDARQSVGFSVDEVIRLCQMGVYGPADVERVASRGLLSDRDLAALDEAGIPVPAAALNGG